MNNQHTQARLRVPDDGTVGSIETEDGTPIGHTFQVSAHDQRIGSPIRRANARRLAACWNACEGIPTDTLERYYGDQGGIDAALDEASLRDHTKAIQQRDQLLKALQAAVECSMVPKSSAREGGAMAYARQAQVADMIRDAIAACQPVPAVARLASDETEGGAA